MKVMIWIQSPQLPLLAPALNVIAQTYGALEFVGMYAFHDTHTRGVESPFDDQRKTAYSAR